MEMIETIRSAWGWKGIRPAAVVDQNSFGNLIVVDDRGTYWRICPEELSCVPIAHDENEFEKLLSDQEYQRDWHMADLAADAHKSIGATTQGRCYCLKIPAVLGGEYAVANIGTVSITELIACAGDMARQIDGQQDGAKVKLVIGKEPSKDR